MIEPAHVYQNREDGYTLDQMHYCEACNGYYGVPHEFDHERHLMASRGPLCACRGHREAVGLPREGDFGWILDGEQQ